MKTTKQTMTAQEAWDKSWIECDHCKTTFWTDDGTPICGRCFYQKGIRPDGNYNEESYHTVLVR